MSTCSTDDCGRPTIARGMCTKHYQRWKRRNPDELNPTVMGVPAIDRLLSRCVDQDGCWVYTGPTDTKGYVRIRADGGKQFGHRIAWEFFRSEWPDDLTYDHLCRNPSCVNPWHGDPVPAVVNIRRGGNAQKTHCPEGHPLSGDNVRYASRGEGRVCRICRAESSRRYRRRTNA